MANVFPVADCQHIADYYQHAWEAHPCIAFNLLRLGYKRWACGDVPRDDKFNNLYEENANE